MIENNPRFSDSLGWENLSSVKMKTDITQLFQVEGGGRNEKLRLLTIKLEFVFNNPMLNVRNTPREFKKSTLNITRNTWVRSQIILNVIGIYMIFHSMMT